MLAKGAVLPPLEQIRDVSATIATAVATYAWNEGLATKDRPDDVEAYIRANMYDPQYESYV